VIRLLTTAFLLSLYFCAGTADARPHRVAQIPNGNVNDCANCHVNAAGGGARNAFGSAVEAGLDSNGPSGNVQWNATLAGADSDGDGATNGLELQDPTGVWSSGQAAPGDRDLVTLPGSAASVPNQLPVFAVISPVSVQEGALVNFLVEATDADEDPITLEIGELPQGATFENGTFMWTPGFDQAGSYDIVVSANDGTATTMLMVTITVADSNRLPLFVDVPDQETTEGAALSFQLEATDADGEPVTFSSSNLPSGATLTGGLFTWTLGSTQAGAYDIVFAANDGVGLSTLTVSVAVENVITGPELTSVLPAGLVLALAVDDTVRLTVMADVPEGLTASFAWTVNSESAAETGGSYLHTVSGEDEVTVEITDGTETISRSWSIVQGITGDYDGDLVVGFSDFLLFASAFGSVDGDTKYEARFDLVPNGRIDFEDFLAFVSHFGNRA